MARPQLTGAKRRSAKVGLRFRPADLAAVTAAAKRDELHPVEFIRRAALEAAEGRGGARGRQRIEQDLLEEQVLRRRELVRIGSNLNQFLRLAHQGKAGILPDALRELLIKLCEQVAAEGTAR